MEVKVGQKLFEGLPVKTVVFACSQSSPYHQLLTSPAAMVTEPTEKLCSQTVQPHLNSVLEQLMEPISSGFQEGRRLIETLMDEVCRGAQTGDTDEVRKVRTQFGLVNGTLLVSFICSSSVCDVYVLLKSN